MWFSSGYVGHRIFLSEYESTWTLVFCQAQSINVLLFRVYSQSCAPVSLSFCSACCPRSANDWLDLICLLLAHDHQPLASYMPFSLYANTSLWHYHHLMHSSHRIKQPHALQHLSENIQAALLGSNFFPLIVPYLISVNAQCLFLPPSKLLN